VNASTLSVPTTKAARRFIGTAATQSSRLTTTQTAVQTDVVFRDVQVVHSAGASLQRAESRITLSYAGGRAGNITVNVSDSLYSPSAGKLTLGASAPANGLGLHVSDTFANAATPPTVTVAAGTLTKAFTIVTSAGAADQTGTLAAGWGGAFGVGASEGLTLRAISVRDVTLTPNPISGGKPVAGVVTLECAAGPGDITVARRPMVASRPRSS
jgi:hypothetical protein